MTDPDLLRWWHTPFTATKPEPVQDAAEIKAERIERAKGKKEMRWRNEAMNELSHYLESSESSTYHVDEDIMKQILLEEESYYEQLN